MPDTIDVILLASGFSRRFGGGNKLLRTFRGKTLIARALELACSLPYEGKVILVHAAEEVAAAAAGLPVRTVRNLRPERGMCESVRLGVEASSAGYYLFMPCDQPLLDAATIDAVISRRAPGRIVVPRHAGSPGNPALFSAAFREELRTLPDGDSPRLLKKRRADSVQYADIDDPLPLFDIDTEEDLPLLEEKARGKLKNKFLR